MSGRVRVLCADVDAVTENEVVDKVDDAIAGKQKLRLGVVNAAKLVKMCSDEQLKEDVVSAAGSSM